MTEQTGSMLADKVSDRERWEAEQRRAERELALKERELALKEREALRQNRGEAWKSGRAVRRPDSNHFEFVDRAALRRAL